MKQKVVILLHGGAGEVNASIYQKRCQFLQSLADGKIIALQNGADALDVVIRSVCCIEDSGLFNAGSGSVLNLAGEQEMDASVMVSDGRFGGVGAVRGVRNPILLARAVMEQTPHLILVGEGASRLAKKLGLPKAEPISESRWYEYQEKRKLVEKQEVSPGNDVPTQMLHRFLEGGTVGAVACDISGRTAAATSTGGLWLKLPGRVGDTALLGAGTYADPLGASSATGYGEGIIRLAVTRRWVENLRRFSPQKALNRVLDECTLAAVECGIIGVKSKGSGVFGYNTPQMSIGRAEAWI